MKNGSIDSLFATARVSIFNTKEDAGLQNRMKLYGISPERIQEGDNLLTNARQLHTHKDALYFEWLNLSGQVEKDRESTLATFIDHVHVARIAFRKRPEILHQLKINRINRRKLWEWTVQADRFYKLISAHAATMKKFGITAEELQQARAGIEALLALKDRRTKKKAEAESATQKRNVALDALHAWLVEFRAVARLALKDTPQMLEAFGMKKPS